MKLTLPNPMFSSLETRYEIKQQIGDGGYSKVYLAFHKASHKQVTIKSIRKTSAPIKVLENEIQIHRICTHANICSLYDVVETDDSFFLVMEYLPRGTLLQKITDEWIITESVALKYFGQIVMALDYLHSNGICHRDIKPENIMFDENDNLRLIDFGMSKQVGENNLMATMCGTLFYASPEIFSGEQYTKETDIWSLGIVLFAMCARRLPFSSEQDEKVTKEIQNSEIKYPKHFSQPLLDLLQKMLKKNPAERITIQEIKSHEWLHGYEFNAMPPTSFIDWRSIPADAYVMKKMFERSKLNECFNSDIQPFSFLSARGPIKKVIPVPVKPIRPGFNVALGTTHIRRRVFSPSPVIVRKQYVIAKPVFAELP